MFVSISVGNSTSSHGTPSGEGGGSGEPEIFFRSRQPKKPCVAGFPNFAKKTRYFHDHFRSFT